MKLAVSIFSLVAAAVIFCKTVQAAEIRLEETEQMRWGLRVSIALEGPIVKGDAEKFERLLDSILVN